MLTLISARLYRPSQFTLPMPTSPRMLLMIPPSVASMNFHTVPTMTMEEITGMNRALLKKLPTLPRNREASRLAITSDITV